MLPVDVLVSAAGRTLPHVAHRVLVALAAQYTGRANGSLTMTQRTAREYGVRDPHALYWALDELEARGLIVRTRPGTRVPPKSAMYAVCWRQIDEPMAHDPHHARSTLSPSHAYSTWVPSQQAPYWSTQRLGRESRWRVPSTLNGASPHEEPLISGASPVKEPISPVARPACSDISGQGPTCLASHPRVEA